MTLARMHRPPANDPSTFFIDGRIESPLGRVQVLRVQETHTARVYLSSTHAFKVRKPVNLGFLDYSTPEKRRLAANTEVSIGHRVSSHVHIGVWTLPNAKPSCLVSDDAEGEPVVVMRRLPDELQMERLFADSTTHVERVDAVALACARFHAACPVDLRPEGYGALPHTIGAWTVNFEQLPAHDPTVPLSTSERQQLIAETEEWLARLRSTLTQRITEGRIREGHGDLRLQHVYLTDPWSVIDPLEFSIALRFCDVAAEVCFLAMELDDLGRRDAADRLLSQYAAATQDSTLELVAPFFKRYRAVVRAKVEWIRAGQTADSERDMHLAASRRLFHLALSYAAVS